MPLKIFDDDELLTEDEARAEVNVRCTRTLRRWRVLGEGPPYCRIGRKIYYRRGALRRWVLSREQDASPPSFPPPPFGRDRSLARAVPPRAAEANDERQQRTERSARLRLHTRIGDRK